ncbi:MULTISPECIES: cyclase family protein [unclassified Rhodococcus (in: high G+C Gram-positive bacteria)]|uniref:cyclase family protein n=1 Tax=unclassified Rhodococcus (in: high G+C Gram-positive bacteria) TaxID=192944 RepID=UPI00163B3C8C|nr:MULTISPECIES: cyclase family protein [unclassified Rhodococcus (in: high G+C Gram-positive bacteria)]MBC2642610.1 cyclase family protein [Rhodococcus sp. 3A]MBC2892648.1 cyclase family protein [Rhodococcus sp. 4CII]
MSVITDLLASISNEHIELIDLTAPLTDKTPVLALPEPFKNTLPFQLEVISRFDEDGPGWYWNNIHTGEHTGTHIDAPNHWITGRDGLDVSQVPLRSLIAPAVVLDVTDRVAQNPDFLLDVTDIEEWQRTHGAFPAGGWLLYRTGWSVRSGSSDDFLNADASGPHTPGFTAECARWLAEETDLVGVGVETVGTDAGQATALDPAFPCHHHLLGAGKLGLTQLQNLDHLPATGFALAVLPLPIVGGSGSPARVVALVEK